MLDFSHIPTPYGAATVETFIGNSPAIGQDWVTWVKPRGKTMCNILLIGKGGNGGVGVNNAAAAGGGGGGGSGAQTSITVPLWAIPDRLYLSLCGIGTVSAAHSYITISPKMTAGAGAPTANDVLVYAAGGAVGNNAATTTGGTANTAAAAATAANMPLGWQWLDSALAGQAGTAGGAGTTTGTVGGALTIPVTGLLVTGGSGGGATPTTVGAGTAGGLFTVGGMFATATHPAATGGTGTTPPTLGRHGYNPIGSLMFWYGGTGGGGVGSNATGAGLVQASGGNGGIGCGGGGSGGGFTGSAAGTVGLGGPAFCQITCW
jgi:hypothetical protein